MGELKALKEREVMLDLLVRRDQLALLDFKDLLDQLEQEVKEEKKVLLVNRELLVLVEGQVTKDLLELLEQWVHQDPLVYLDHLEKLDLMDQQESVVNVVLLVLPVLLDPLEQLENLDSKVPEVLRVPRDIVVSLVFKVCQALLDLEEKKAHQEKTERTEILELLVLVDHLELMVLWDKWVILDLPVQEVLKEKKESVVHQVSLDQWGLLDLLEKDLDLTWQLCLL